MLPLPDINVHLHTNRNIVFEEHVVSIYTIYLICLFIILRL